MAGKICVGSSTNNAGPAKQIRESRAYCEGIAHRSQGTAIAFPITDNPYDSTQHPLEEAAWDAGWNAADGAAGGDLTGTCCADAIGIVA